MDWIRESNLIEGVDEAEEDRRSLRAWKWLLKQPFNLETILKLHRKIMLKKLGKEAGHLRVCNVRVGNRTCSHYETVPGLLHEWIHRWGTIEVVPLIKKAHIEYEYIHPFVDGNGRTGRMIMNWQRVKAGLEPLLIRASERYGYYKWFDENL